jgi:thiol-disulfide isomerase/thioredoxin
MMKKYFNFAVSLLLILSFPSKASELMPGPWRFELKTTNGTVPFVINFTKKRSSFSGVLKNGKEEIRLNRIILNKKGIIIPMPIYETTLEMKFSLDGKMQGQLVRHNKNPKIKIPLIATFGQTERFPGTKEKPSINLTGRWSVTLNHDNSEVEKGVIVFEQKDQNFFASILTPTGDYRYLEGYVSGNEFEAASFDGVYNYLFKGKVIDQKLQASILSSYKSKIEGKKDESAQLPDAYLQTQIQHLKFEFSDLQGNKYSLADLKFKNKPVIVQFFGSWCPNCIDETNYLIPWYKQNQKRGIEIVALAFERSLSFKDAKKQLLKAQKNLQIPYTLLLAGATSDDKPMDKIQGLKNFISFPTTIFLNHRHEVIKVHAGFTGPSTGEFFEKWKKEFNQTIDELLKK